MKESRKIWKLKSRPAQYYCAAVFGYFSGLFLASALAASQPDPLLDPPTLCEGKVAAADLTEGTDIYGHPVAPASTGGQVQGSPVRGPALLPVRTPVRRFGRLELPVDVSGLLQPPLPACLTPEQAHENTPPKSRSKR